jgi:hypothetical protein
MNTQEVSWSVDEEVIRVMYQGSTIIRISMHEAIELCGRAAVMQHVKECDSTPWLTQWTIDKHNEIIDILRDENV